MTAVLTLEEVAALYRCSKSTIRRAVQSGELGSVRVLGVVRVPVSCLPASLALPRTTSAVVDPSSASASAVDGSTSGAADAGDLAGEVEVASPAAPSTHNQGGSSA